MLSAALLLLAAFGASLLTFVSGFGLGTLLLPAFALFVPLPVAVTLTAVVHVLNNLFKFSLLRPHIHRPTVVRFGLPAIGGALLGAWLLVSLGKLEPLYYGVNYPVAPLKVTIALLMVVFALLELTPAMRNYRFPAQAQTLGGLVSGFFGGLSGHQGALRSMFLVHGGLEQGRLCGHRHGHRAAGGLHPDPLLLGEHGYRPAYRATALAHRLRAGRFYRGLVGTQASTLAHVSGCAIRGSGIAARHRGSVAWRGDLRQIPTLLRKGTDRISAPANIGVNRGGLISLYACGGNICKSISRATAHIEPRPRAPSIQVALV
ncbi:MAG: sulfite exporter TauE/SafE family protein [Flavobacteriales bacterium]|nr:sulfite exporter TauE/SafE family protein [Flavobacteriales bacterium]